MNAATVNNSRVETCREDRELGLGAEKKTRDQPVKILRVI
jgi:hypothetical protein